MEKLVTRAYNRFDIDNRSGIMRKISSTERLKDEIIYYHILNRDHSRQAIYFPRIIDSKHHGESEYWMDLEMYDYQNVGKYMLGENIMPSWAEFFTSLRDILLEFGTLKPYSVWTDEDITTAAHDMYITKTEKEYQNFYDGWKDKLEYVFADQLIDQTLYINDTL